MPNTFIDAYLNHTAIYESPLSFWKWSAYTTIAAVLKDRCYLKQGDSFLYPNIYVLILAESSGHRKNRPIVFSEELVGKVSDTKTISGRASVQGIMDELARAETDPNTGKVVKSGSAIFYAPELSAGIVADPEAMKILTDIYDYKPNAYKSRLRTGPSFNIDKIIFSMFSATNQDMIRDMFTEAVVKGGFLARTFLIVPNEFRKSNSLMRVDQEALKVSKDATVDKLKKVSQLHGEFKLTDEAIDEYTDWYDPFRQEYMKKKDTTGLIGRIHTSIIKLAMILAANDLTMCIGKNHMEQAINESLGLIPNYNIFTMNHSKTETGHAGGLVVTDLMEAPGYTLSVKTIFRSHWQDFDQDVFDKVVAMLETAGMIRQIHNKSELLIQLTDTALVMLGAKKDGESDKI